MTIEETLQLVREDIKEMDLSVTDAFSLSLILDRLAVTMITLNRSVEILELRLEKHVTS